MSFSITQLFKRKSTTGSGAYGSVFLKTADANAKIAVAKARIQAVDTLNNLSQKIAADLENEAERVHSGADVAAERLEAVLAKL